MKPRGKKTDYRSHRYHCCVLFFSLLEARILNNWIVREVPGCHAIVELDFTLRESGKLLKGFELRNDMI